MVKKLLIFILLFVCGIVSAEWSPHNKAGEMSALYCGNLVSYSTHTTGSLVLNKNVIAMSSTTIIPLSSAFMVVDNVTGVIDRSSGTPSLALGTTGQIVILRGNDDTYPTILADEGELTGSRLQLSATTHSIGLYDILILIFDGIYWVECGFINN